VEKNFIRKTKRSSFLSCPMWSGSEGAFIEEDRAAVVKDNLYTFCFWIDIENQTIELDTLLFVIGWVIPYLPDLEVEEMEQHYLRDSLRFCRDLSKHKNGTGSCRTWFDLHDARTPYVGFAFLRTPVEEKVCKNLIEDTGGKMDKFFWLARVLRPWKFL